MKPSPNNSTSKASKSEKLRILAMRGATELIFDFWVPNAPIYLLRKFERIRKKYFLIILWTNNVTESSRSAEAKNELDGPPKTKIFQIGVKFDRT